MFCTLYLTFTEKSGEMTMKLEEDFYFLHLQQITELNDPILDVITRGEGGGELGNGETR